MSQRIADTFKASKEQSRPALVTFTMAYDPDHQASVDILNQLPDAGADIIELGVPFSDPVADGKTIQNAGQRALEAGASLQGVLDMVASFREQNQTTPIILMGYYNPILHFGIADFIAKASEAGVDGLIVVDLPPEEDQELYDAAQAKEIDLIKLVTPTTDENRLKVILEKASGFLYYVAVAGVTGTKSATESSIADALSMFRKHTDIPLAVGFGIKSKEQVDALKDIADGVVVGSALIKLIEENPGEAVEKVIGAVEKLSGGD